MLKIKIFYLNIILVIGVLIERCFKLYEKVRDKKINITSNLMGILIIFRKKKYKELYERDWKNGVVE